MDVTVNRTFTYNPPQGVLDILHIDDDLILINKPSGLLSVPGKAETHKDSLQTRLKSEHPDSLLVHRLDMATSGIMVFARNKAAQRHLGLQFEKRYIEKTYVTVVAGIVEQDEGEIDLPLIADWPNRPRQKVDFEIGKSALTKWEIAERLSDRTRLYLYPKTGRSHQLRVHMMEIGHPILGDRIYAGDESFKAAPRLLLHAEGLMLRHPNGGEPREFICKSLF